MSEEQPQLLVPVDTYLKSGIHIGTKFKTKFMKQFIYKTRPDGLSVLNLQKIDDRLRTTINFLSQYDPKDILVACRRENGWKSVKKFGEATGARVFAGRYPPGILTNVSLENFIEVKLILVVDPWPDRNVVNDGIINGTPIISLCDTNNNVNNIDLVIPSNNKGKKSLGLIFWLLARGYLRQKGLLDENVEMDMSVDDFTEE